jgi:hypothetical protein
VVAPVFPAGRPDGRADVLLAAPGAAFAARLAADFAALLLPEGVGGLRSGMVLLPAADGIT